MNGERTAVKCHGCGKWNDCGHSNEYGRHIRPRQCEHCGRQLYDRVNPDGRHERRPDQATLSGERAGV